MSICTKHAVDDAQQRWFLLLYSSAGISHHDGGTITENNQLLGAKTKHQERSPPDTMTAECVSNVNSTSTTNKFSFFFFNSNFYSISLCRRIIIFYNNTIIIFITRTNAAASAVPRLNNVAINGDRSTAQHNIRYIITCTKRSWQLMMTQVTGVIAGVFSTVCSRGSSKTHEQMSRDRRYARREREREEERGERERERECGRNKNVVEMFRRAQRILLLRLLLLFCASGLEVP